MRRLLCGCFGASCSQHEGDDGRRSPPPRQTNAAEAVELDERATAVRTASRPRIPTPAQSTPEPPPSAPSTAAVPTQQRTRENLWQKAMEKLSEEDRDFLTSKNKSSPHADGISMMNPVNGGNGVVHLPASEPSEISDTQQVDAIIGLIREVRTSRNRREFTFLDQRYSLSDIYSNTISWLNKFKDIGDVATQYDPVHAALPWAATRLILQIVIAYKKHTDEAMAIIEKTSRIIHQCTIYEEICVHEGGSTKISDQIRDLLTVLYVLVLKVLVQVGRFFHKNGPSGFSEAVIRPEKFPAWLSDIETAEKHLLSAVSAFHMYRTTMESRDIVQKLDALLSLESPILRIDEGVHHVLKQIQSQRLLKILKWISDIAYYENHQLVRESRTVGTCDWVIQTPQFREWETNGSSIRLWLYGPAGWGKTYLVSKVIDLMNTSLDNGRENEGFAFFYCNHTDARRRLTLAVLRSFLRQLASTRFSLDPSSGRIHPELQSLYDQSERKGSGWTIGQCREYLLKILNFYPRTTLVLDALDECEDRADLLNVLDGLCRDSHRPVKILISSRPEADIRDRLSTLTNIEITAAKNDKDIEAFIHESMLDYHPWTPALEKTEGLKHEIITTLVSKSGGMFQWVSLQIDQLRKRGHEKDIRQRLEVLPEGLTKAYDEIYKHIEARGDFSRTQTIRALSWVLSSFKPLNSEQLLSACSVDADTETGSIDASGETTEQDLLGWCASLLVLDSSTNPPVWRPSHFSVSEYFKPSQGLGDMQCMVARACLVVLLNRPKALGSQSDGNESDGPGFPTLLDNSIWGYAGFHWHQHVQTQDKPGCNALLGRLLKRFLNSPMTPSAEYEDWRATMAEFSILTIRPHSDSQSLHSQPIEIDDDDWDAFKTPLAAMCYFSIFHLLYEWWDLANFEFISLDDLYHNGRNMLAISAAAGCLDIVNNIMQRGMPVNCGDKVDSIFGSPLTACSAHGDQKIVRLLLEYDAGVNILMSVEYGFGDACYDSALSAAAGAGNLEICQILLEAGADVNLLLQSGTYGSALAAAIWSGNLGVCRLLLGAGADVNLLLQAGDYGSALAAAARTRNLERCRLLLGAGADVNLLLQAGHYGSALAAAAQTGNLKTCQLLLGAGADVNLLLQSGTYGSALAAAIWSGNLGVCRLLLGAGADVNLLLQAGRYSSALVVAIRSEMPQAVELLLENGADIHQQLQVGQFGNALEAAESLEDDYIYNLLVARSESSRVVCDDIE